MSVPSEANLGKLDNATRSKTNHNVGTELSVWEGNESYGASWREFCQPQSLSGGRALK